MIDKKYCIYIHINKINGKVYIGQTNQKPEYRWNHGNGYKECTRFYAAIQKYGWNNFEHKILFTDLSLEQANDIEYDLINKYRADEKEFGYNLDKGGNNKGTAIETRLKQSQSALLRPIVSKETKEKLSKVSKGIKRKEETKYKMSIASFKREEYKKQHGIKKFRKVKCLNTNQIFNSCREAADWCGLAGTSGIALVCNGGKQKTAGVHPITKEKLKWEYVD